MVKKDKKWEWTEKQEKVFKELKRQFTEELVLAAPDLDKKMRMEVDASDYAMGVLSMECEDGSRCIRLHYRRYCQWSVKMDYGDWWHSSLSC